MSALPLLVLMVMSAGLVALIPPQPASAGHLCGGTGSPYGPFDLQTYEDANHKTTYARTLELAGLNQLLPDRPTFNLHALEVGPREAGSGQLAAPYIPPVLLKAIAWIESGWNQAAGSVQYGQVGPVLASHDCGYGLMQVTSGMQNVSGVPSLDQAMIGGHYAFNIARGARILAEKWNNAPEFRPIVGDRNPYVIENWYYALWAYNGFAFKNHPMNPQYDPNRPAYRCDGSQPRSAYPYQELIIGCVNHPPSRSGTQLWSPQPASQPNLSHPGVATPGAPLDPAHWEACSQRLQCAPMDMPTPGPPHTDPTGPAAPREAVIGVPSISVSTGGIALAAVPGAESQPVNVTIANSGSGVLGWRATASASWLKMWRAQGVSLGPDLGSVSHTIRVYADTGGLPPGNYSGHLTIESLYASGAPAIIPVTLQVDLKAGATISSDFTGDGLSDIVFLCCSDYASLWLNQGGDNFGVRVFRPWPGYGMQAGLWQSGDFNGDGRSDLAHLCCGDYGNLWLSNGDGTFRLQTFRPWPGYGLQSGSWMTGDFNGDSRTDLLHLCCGDYANVWFSNPNGTFAVYAARPWPGYGAQGGTWQTADVNGDRKTDLVHLCCNDFVNTWLSNGDGSFAISAFGAWPGYGLQSGFWIAGNLNNDGKTDLLHFCCGDYVNSWLSTGDGRFAVVAFNPWPGYQLFSGSVQAGDLNGDGTMDILHQCCPDYVHSWLSTGDGRFSLGAFNPWPGYPIRMGFWQPGQFNGDGKMDLLHVCCHYAHIWRSTGRGDFTIGTFVP